MMMIKMNGVVEEDGFAITGVNVSVMDEELPDLDGAADLSDDEEVEDDEESDEDEDNQVEDESPTTTSPRLAKLLADIAEAEMLCANAEEAVNEAKAVLKEAKAEYDGCVVRLRKLAKAVKNDENRPLFDGLEDGDSDDLADDQDDGEPLTDQEEDDARYTALLATSIDVLRLPAGVVSKLAEEHVETIGQLEQLRQDITLGRKQWPKGIGPAKVDLIETCVTEWLADNYSDNMEVESDDEVEGDEE